MINTLETIEALEQELKTAVARLQLDVKATRLAELDAQMAEPDFWSDSEKAQKASKAAGTLRDTLATWRGLEKELQGLKDTLELLAMEGKEPGADFDRDLSTFQKNFEAHQVELYLNGPYDNDPAIVSLHAGTGGVDAQDFTEMLARMILRYAEKQGFKATLLDSTAGNEAGLKSASYKIEGPHAYGYLKNENGVHRLVRISPFNKGTRETSFALIEVTPEVEATEVEIKDEDIRWDVFRAGGKGGQGVNTTDSAVRLTHIPTGIVITCQNERSQLQNKQQALSTLKGKLLALQEQFHLQTVQDIRGDHVQGSWGNQIRSYVLQPYQMVKDHRTDHETSQVYDVLDGDLQPFIEANLRK